MRVFILWLCLFFCIAGSGQFQGRTKISINSGWHFIKDDQKGLMKANPEVVHLPHTWNAIDPFDEDRGYYMGKAVYYKSLVLSKSYKNRNCFLYFEGVNQVATVFINGQKLAVHKGGYTSFAVDITPYVSFKNSDTARVHIKVNVDNRIDQDIPPLSGDFNFYGGIYRDVYLISTSMIHFDVMDHGSSGIYIFTPQVNEQEAHLEIRSKIRNLQDHKRMICVRHLLFDQENRIIKKFEKELRLNSSRKEIMVKGVVSEPELWSPEDPCLYYLKSQVLMPDKGEILDEVINPVGLRWFSFDADSGLYLNGKHVKLIGVNRHQDFLGKGNALNNELHLRDVKLIKEMGANFIRIAHYPQDPAVLNACDEMGIIVSQEIPIVNKITESETFTENCLNMMNEMISRDFNHPSVFIWAYMNEVLLKLPYKEQPERQRMYLDHVTKLARKIDSFARKMDPDRYTMISNHQKFDRYHKAELTNIPMIVGWNLYPGWYGEHFYELDSFLIRHKKELPGKPLVITEYGAGSDPRIRAFQPERFDFSIEWANKYHQYYLKAIQKYKHVAGAAIWNFADFGSEGRKDAVPRINSKGIMTFDRKPKDTYLYYKANLQNDDVLEFADKLSTHRAGISSQEGSFCLQPVVVYTNLNQVELFHNGRSLGVQQNDKNIISWNVPFKGGENHLWAKNFDAESSVMDVIQVDFKLYSNDFNDGFDEIFVNTGSHYYYFDQDSRNIWLPDQAYQKGTYGYTGDSARPLLTWGGYRIGTYKDILESNDDPLFQTQLISPGTFRFDVPAGMYEVTLLFAEVIAPKEEKRLHNTGRQVASEYEVSRDFDVLVNGLTVIEGLDVQNQFGSDRAVKITFRTESFNREGIEISFHKGIGEPVLSGIRLKRIFNSCY
jgi:beta-galactosidase